MKVLILTSPLARQAACRHVMEAEEGLEVVIRPAKKNKTTEQRNWWHWMCAETGKHLGYTKGQIKQMVKQDFFGTDEVLLGSKVYFVLQSSEDADRIEYSDIIDFTYQWSAERGVTLPAPMNDWRKRQARAA